MEAPYIDLHTHHRSAPSQEVLQLISLDLGQWSSSTPPERSYYSLGLHPWYIDQLPSDALTLLEQGLTTPQVLALGEAGLDKLCGTDFEQQQRLLHAQIELSETHQLPLILHIVKAVDEVLALRKQLRSQQTWIIHGFRGKHSQAAQLLKQGFHLSFGQYFHPESLDLAYAQGRAFLETDTSPHSIDFIYEQAALSLGIKLNELRSTLYQNYQDILRP